MSKILSKEEVENKLSNNARLKNAVEDIKQVFSNKFYLTNKDMEEIIIDIISKCDEEIVENLSYIFLEFVENDIKDFSIIKRRTLAKMAIKNCLDLYNSEVNQIQEEFFEILKESKKYNIDPFRLAIKRNLKMATVRSFNETLKSLVFTEYEGIEKDKKENLFQQDDIKKLFEQCAGLACGISEKCVQNVLNTLSRFVMDENGNYIVSPKNIISKCLSLLEYGTPKKIRKLEEMIEFLKNKLVPNEMTNNELILKVSDNPSVLLLTPDKVLNIENQLVGAIYKIIKNPNFTGKIDDIDRFSLEEAQKFSYNFDNFNDMRGLKTDRLNNLDKICDVLISNLGADNALKCITNMRILNTDTEVLDCFLTKLAVQEKELNLDLRKFFIENPYKCLNLIEQENVGSIIADKVKGHRRTMVIKALDVPNDINEEEFKNKYNHLNLNQKKKVDDLSKNILEEIKKQNEEKKAKKIQNKIENENILINGVEEKLSTLNFNNIYSKILTKYKMLLDEKYGSGYSQKNYYIDDYINYYSDLVSYNKKFVELNKELQNFKSEIVKLSLINIRESSLSSIETDSNEFISKMEDFGKRFTNFKKEKFIKLIKEPENRLLELDEKFGFSTHKKIMENYNEIISILTPSIYVDFIEISSCMSYLEYITNVIKKEFQNSYEKICPEYEKESLLKEEFPFAEKIISIHNENEITLSMINIFKNFIENEFNVKCKKIVESVGGIVKTPYQTDITSFNIQNSPDFNKIRNDAIMLPYEERRKTIDKLTDIQNNFITLQNKYIFNSKIETIDAKIKKYIKNLFMFESEQKLYFSEHNLSNSSTKAQAFSLLKNNSNYIINEMPVLTKENVKNIDDLPLNNYMAYVIQKYAGVDNKQIQIEKEKFLEK